MVKKAPRSRALRQKIYDELTRYYREQGRVQSRFTPGKSKVQYSGPVYDEEELIAITDALLDGWFGVGQHARELEQRFARFLGSREAILVNSGSSANLLAVSALVASGKLRPGDEVITPAVTFPTTLNPVIQNGLKPVLVDVDLETLNIQVERLEEAVSPQTRLLMLPHTMGNPLDMDQVMEVVNKYGLYLIEDSCDALGSTYRGKLTGTFGVFGTFSFYVAHQMTLGEGGAVVTSDNSLSLVVRSLRDWGRACVCPICPVSIDRDFQCLQRFVFETNTLPEGYDKRYVYQTIGYNLKPVEFQAAMGLVQLKRLPRFIAARRENFAFLRAAMAPYSEYFILPRVLPEADPSWFAFPLTIRDGAPFTRQDIVGWLEEHNIETRMLFAGNIARQPAYKGVEFRFCGGLENSDKVMRDTLFIGVYPGITPEQRAYIVETVSRFMKRL